MSNKLISINKMLKCDQQTIEIRLKDHVVFKQLNVSAPLICGPNLTLQFNNAR